MVRKKKAQKFVSPAGIAFYPHLNEADTEYNPNGIFHSKLRMDTDNSVVAAFIAQVDQWHSDSLDVMKQELVDSGKAKTLAIAEKKVKDGDKPYVYEEDDDGEPTNIVRVNFKMKHRVENRQKEGEFWTFTPTFVDSKGAVIKGDAPLVYGGSILKIRFTPVLWNTIKLGASVQLRMDAVQIIELVTGGEGNSDGFGEEDGTYVAPTAEKAGFTDESAGPTVEDDGDF